MERLPARTDIVDIHNESTMRRILGYAADWNTVYDQYVTQEMLEVGQKGSPDDKLPIKVVIPTSFNNETTSTESTTIKPYYLRFNGDISLHSAYRIPLPRKIIHLGREDRAQLATTAQGYILRGADLHIKQFNPNPTFDTQGNIEEVNAESYFELEITAELHEEDLWAQLIFWTDDTGNPKPANCSVKGSPELLVEQNFFGILDLIDKGIKLVQMPPALTETEQDQLPPPSNKLQFLS